MRPSSSLLAGIADVITVGLDGRAVLTDRRPAPRSRAHRVLRDVAAKRALLTRFEELVSVGKGRGSVLGGDVGEEYLLVVLPALAAEYADRPGYRDEWRP